MSVEGGPMRTCVGCRGKAPTSELLRAVARAGVVVPDLLRRMPGRGAYLHRDADCLEQAVRRRAFPRALRVPAPLDLSALRAELSGDAPCCGRRSGDVGATH